MKRIYGAIGAALLLIYALPCRAQSAADSVALVRMVEARATAMSRRDLAAIQAQYSPDITFINTAGFYLTAGDMARFDSVLFAYDSTHYKTGRVSVRLLDASNALVYYAWQVDRFRKVKPLLNEIGLMTLSAQKRNGTWKWIAITNQATPMFIDELEQHRRYPQGSVTPPPN